MLTNAPIHVIVSTSLADSIDLSWLLLASSEWAFHPEYLGISIQGRRFLLKRKRFPFKGCVFHSKVLLIQKRRLPLKGSVIFKEGVSYVRGAFSMQGVRFPFKANVFHWREPLSTQKKRCPFFKAVRFSFNGDVFYSTEMQGRQEFKRGNKG